MEDFTKLSLKEIEEKLLGLVGEKVQIMYDSPETDVIGPSIKIGKIMSVEYGRFMLETGDDETTTEEDLEVGGILELKVL